MWSLEADTKLFIRQVLQDEKKIPSTRKLIEQKKKRNFIFVAVKRVAKRQKEYYEIEN